MVPESAKKHDTILVFFFGGLCQTLTLSYRKLYLPRTSMSAMKFLPRFGELVSLFGSFNRGKMLYARKSLTTFRDNFTNGYRHGIDVEGITDSISIVENCSFFSFQSIIYC